MPQRYSFLTPGSVMKALLDSHFFTVERRTAVDFSDEPAVAGRLLLLSCSEVGRIDRRTCLLDADGPVGERGPGD